MKTAFRRIGVGILGILIAMSIGLIVSVYGVEYPVETLTNENYGSLVIIDRNGIPLRRVNVHGNEQFSPRHRFVKLNEIDSQVISTLLASEDKNFFQHSGVDVTAILRALYLNIREGGAQYGASTITMQLMRMVHSRGESRTFWNKIKETILALRLERQVSKSFILEQYLNRAYFGNQAFGIEAAARRYFGKSASALSTAEATYLAVLPRGPSYYNPFRHHQRVLARRAHIFQLLTAQGRLSTAEAKRAGSERISPSFHPFAYKAPHFVDWVLNSIDEPTARSGGVITTTLDSYLQKEVEHSVREHVARLRPRGVEQAGVVVLDTRTGKVLAMVGATSGQKTGNSAVNITTRRRHPGSALKPFVYATAIELGDSPASIVMDRMDVSSEYRVTGRPPKERGAVSYREALAGSYNIAAIHVLEKVGVTRVMEKLRAAGVSALPQHSADYGLRLALGDTKVRLVDLAAGYGFLVREGKVALPRNIETVTDPDGNVHSFSMQERTVFSPQAAWLTMDMLSDPDARRKVFGDELPADLPYRVTVKTGTARGFSDTVAVFATREFVVAAWTGRFDGKPTKGVLGMSGAAPLARDALLLASDGKMLTLPKMPPGVERATICATTGKPASVDCPRRKLEYFVEGTVPAE
ncbi:MAG: transglycosylase domain-containing protein [Deltaproteobacteria bacterium]|nr:transglycosylase domain-containing protein [Deltaproteobacteria bacterium]MBN2672410.1 transglycosylase domain-containing protein [Deltaproteobacteria bacterium]